MFTWDAVDVCGKKGFEGARMRNTFIQHIKVETFGGILNYRVIKLNTSNYSDCKLIHTNTSSKVQYTLWECLAMSVDQ